MGVLVGELVGEGQTATSDTQIGSARPPCVPEISQIPVDHLVSIILATMQFSNYNFDELVSIFLIKTVLVAIFFNTYQPST